jgi:hypothetical protein
MERVFVLAYCIIAAIFINDGFLYRLASQFVKLSDTRGRTKLYAYVKRADHNFDQGVEKGELKL